MTDILHAFFETNHYYAKTVRVPEEDAAEHFLSQGVELGLRPHPFFKIAPNNKHEITDAELIGAKLEATSVLFDTEYCAGRHGVSPADALKFASSAIAAEEWVDFHPLITKYDFEASGVSSIAVWLDLLHDPGQSLVDHSFCHFMPRYYRATAKHLIHENELLDYLTQGKHSTGLPHVFCVPWFTAQFLDELKNPPHSATLWLDMLADVGGYGQYASPFFEPLSYNHEHNLRDPKATNHDHALTKFTLQKANILAPHPQVLPTALAFAFLDREIDACGPSNVAARDVLCALEIALTTETQMPVTPQLSVCILNFNKPVHTALSAMAAARNAPDATEVLVLDNGSQPKDFELICLLTKQYGNIRVMRSPTNVFFGEGNNILVDQARGEHILFLNNDAYVGPETISGLVEHLDANPDVSACGGTFLFPDLTVQEAGGTISDCGQQVQLHKHSPFALQRRYAQTAEPTETDYISSACFCVRKSVLEDLGGYDALYEPLYFEDTDLCKRITSAGYRIDYLPDRYVIHFENASTREFLGDDFLPQIARNREKFRARWLYKMNGYRPRSMLPQIGPHPDLTRPSAVVFTPYNIGIGGGERYTLALAAELAKTHNVTVACPIPCSRTRMSFAMSDLGIELTPEMSLDIAQIEEVAQSPCDLMVAVGNQAIPPTPMFGKRNIYHCQFPFPGHHENRWQSIRLKNVDAVIVNSAFTRDHLSAHYKGLGYQIPIHVTYAPVKPMEIEARHHTENEAISVINVGRFDPEGHSKRQDIALAVLEKAMAGPADVRLTLLGAVSNAPKRMAYVDDLQSMAQTLNLPVSFIMDAPRSELCDAIAQADIYLHTCGFGADPTGTPERLEHFGIAVVEGMMAGLIPVVYDGGGPAELMRKAGIGYTYRTVDEAAAAIQEISAMPQDEREALGARANAFAQEFSDEAFGKRLRHIVNTVVEEGAEND